MAPITKFWLNGGRIKLLVWLLLVCISFLFKSGWQASKYDSRLLTVEKTVVNHEEILKAIPQIKEDMAATRTDISWIKNTLKSQ